MRLLLADVPRFVGSINLLPHYSVLFARISAQRPLHRHYGRALQQIDMFPTETKALRGIEWVTLVFPDVNMLVHVNVNVPEKVWSHALKAKFRKHGANPCKQNFSGAIFVRGEVAKSVKQIKEGTTLHDGPSCY